MKGFVLQGHVWRVNSNDIRLQGERIYAAFQTTVISEISLETRKLMSGMALKINHGTSVIRSDLSTLTSERHVILNHTQDASSEISAELPYLM